MVRSALASRPGGQLSRGPRRGALVVPALSVLAAILLGVLPIVSDTGWWPDLGLLMLLAWRLLRADAWPSWLAAPLGLVHDLITGAPIGLSLALWPMFMLAMDVIDRRTMWRDYWIEWLLAALFMAFAELFEWQVATWGGAAVPFATVAPSIIVAVACFPIAGYIVARLDRWRLGR